MPAGATAVAPWPDSCESAMPRSSADWKEIRFWKSSGSASAPPSRSSRSASALTLEVVPFLVPPMMSAIDPTFASQTRMWLASRLTVPFTASAEPQLMVAVVCSDMSVKARMFPENKVFWSMMTELPTTK